MASRIPAEVRAGPVLDWRELALCAETDPEAFFPGEGVSARKAKRICAGCEVKGECLDFALTQDEQFGVWGGLTVKQRRKLAARRAAS